MPSRAWRGVVGFGGLYLAVYLVTGVVGHRAARPLYDSTGDVPVAYQWVKPPTDLSVDNVPATAAHASQHVGRGGTVSTDDAQAVLTIPPGAVPPAGGDDTVAIDVEPLAPADLRSVGGARAPDGNAYLVRFTYRPTGTPLTTTARPFDVALREPQYNLVHDVLLWSAGPQGPWRQIPAVQSGPDSLVGPSDRTGYYVLAGQAMTASISAAKVLEVVGAGVVILALIVTAIRRGRRSVAAASSS